MSEVEKKAHVINEMKKESNRQLANNQKKKAKKKNKKNELEKVVEVIMADMEINE